jgi:hypothetical protein
VKAEQGAVDIAGLKNMQVVLDGDIHSYRPEQLHSKH